MTTDENARTPEDGATLTKRPFWCRIGFHDEFYDSIGENVGTEKTPFYVMTTFHTCRRCGHRRLA